MLRYITFLTVSCFVLNLNAEILVDNRIEIGMSDRNRITEMRNCSITGIEIFVDQKSNNVSIFYKGNGKITNILRGIEDESGNIISWEKDENTFAIFNKLQMKNGAFVSVLKWIGPSAENPSKLFKIILDKGNGQKIDKSFEIANPNKM
ncbi:MAG: hypothetical protein IJ730_04840 [Alphaproteobacteria bacterium]|nr:hypothetical protein [Alphaproteobacteria bacterium]